MTGRDEPAAAAAAGPVTAAAPTSGVATPRPRSLRLRLLGVTLALLVPVLGLAGVALGGLFRDHVQRQFAVALTAQLDLLTARLTVDASGQARIDARGLDDPRWSLPYAGLYWQVDRGPAPGRPAAAGVLRSRSLWDAVLVAPVDALEPGRVHVHRVAGPGGASLLLVERRVRADDDRDTDWRLMVAGDLRDTDAAVARLHGVLAVSLGVLGLLLAGAAVAQGAIGLAPLRQLQCAVAEVAAGRRQRLDGPFAAELQPLAAGFDQVLARNADLVARARTQAGNLAHALKTPLAVLSQAASVGPVASTPPDALARLVQEQVALARRQVDWHLARARSAAAQGQPGARAPLAPALASLVRVMDKVHAERGLVLVVAPVPDALALAGDAEDLHTLLGNLLDNACKWARRQVRVEAAAAPAAPGAPAADWLRLTIDDDGPGIAAERRAQALARGARLDEQVPGSGLGLAIVQDLVEGYGGRLELADSPLGGLRVVLELPAAAD